MLRYRSFFISIAAVALLVAAAGVSQWSLTGSANQRFQLQRA